MDSRLRGSDRLKQVISSFVVYCERGHLIQSYSKELLTLFFRMFPIHKGMRDEKKPPHDIIRILGSSCFLVLFCCRAMVFSVVRTGSCHRKRTRSERPGRCTGPGSPAGERRRRQKSKPRAAFHTATSYGLFLTPYRMAHAWFCGHLLQFQFQPPGVTPQSTPQL